METNNIFLLYTLFLTSDCSIDSINEAIKFINKYVRKHKFFCWHHWDCFEILSCKYNSFVHGTWVKCDKCGKITQSIPPAEEICYYA